MNASYIAFFHLILEKIPIKESDVRNIIAEVEAISWCLRECIRVRELAATHRLGRMRRLQMLEEKKACETAAEMDAQRCLRTSLDLEYFRTKLYNPRGPHTPEEHTLEVRVDLE